MAAAVSNTNEKGHPTDDANRNKSVEPEHGSIRFADGTVETAIGYTEQMPRTRSTLNVAFMSFVLASIPYGLATTLYYPLVGGGPVDIIWGWLGVSLIIACVAASLGEITSVYPTAGGECPLLLLNALSYFLFEYTQLTSPKVSTIKLSCLHLFAGAD